MTRGRYKKENYVSGMPLSWWRGHLVGILAARFRKIFKSPALDLGCGHGAASVIMAESGRRVVGVDINSKAIQVAESNANESNMPYRPSFVVATALAMPFKDDSFGGACAFEVLEHIWPDDQPVVHRELRRVLKDRAQLVATVPMRCGSYNKTHVMFFEPKMLRSMCAALHWRVRFCGPMYVPRTHGGGEHIGLVAQRSCDFPKRVYN